jgi:hypothetical protein
MNHAPRYSFRTFILTATLLAGGCHTGSRDTARDRGTGGAPMTASGELATPNPKPMDADAMFFGGQIEAEAMLAKSDAVWRNPGASEPEAGTGERRGGGGGGGGGRRGGGGGGGRRGGGGGGGRGRGEDTESASRDAESPSRGPTLRVSNAPPVQLRLRLTNHGSVAAVVEVIDFNSDLGNFVVEPKKMTLPPGEPTEADPMISRLGVPAVEEIPIVVRMRVNGKIEQQTLKLRPRIEPPLPAPSAGTNPPEAEK